MFNRSWTAVENYADFRRSPEISHYTDFRKITPIRESERSFFRALMDSKRDSLERMGNDQ